MLLIITIIIDSLICLLCVGVALNAVSYFRERRVLRAFVKDITRDSVRDLDAALAVGRFIYANVTRAKDPIFTRILAVFGGAPLVILRNGGCCSGLHRLYITCLDTIGIRAAQITLYHKSGRWCHCATQVTLGTTVCIVDVDYGVLYRAPDGGLMGLKELRVGIEPVFEIFAQGLEAPLCAGYDRDPSPGYPKNIYYDFDFQKTRTANWHKSWLRKKLYGLLRGCSRGHIDSLLLHPILEWPQMLVAATGVCLASALFILRILGAP